MLDRLTRRRVHFGPVAAAPHRRLGVECRAVAAVDAEAPRPDVDLFAARPDQQRGGRRRGFLLRHASDSHVRLQVRRGSGRQKAHRQFPQPRQSRPRQPIRREAPTVDDAAMSEIGDKQWRRDARVATRFRARAGGPGRRHHRGCSCPTGVALASYDRPTMRPLGVGSSSEMQDPEGVLAWIAIVRAAAQGRSPSSRGARHWAAIGTIEASRTRSRAVSAREEECDRRGRAWFPRGSGARTGREWVSRADETGSRGRGGATAGRVIGDGARRYPVRVASQLVEL